MEQYIYMDHAATTAVDPRVLEAMNPYFILHYGNPSSIYSLARSAAKAIEDARQTVAGCLGASRPAEIIFTGSGSESDNLGVRGIALANADKLGRHIITSAVEHHAILHTVRDLEKEYGFRVTVLPVDEYGMVHIEDLREALDDQTVLVSIMMANNEVGTVMPIAEIGALLSGHPALFHVDAVQAAGALPIDVQSLGIDALSISAHKFHGPKGVGALYLKGGVRIRPQITGGGQERKRRAGTENTAGIVGLATALDLAVKEMVSTTNRLVPLRDRLLAEIPARIKRCRVTGHPTRRLPNNASFVFEFVEGESILLNLDLLGVAASSGSACTSGDLDPSHVLRAMGIPVEIAHGSLRLTLGPDNTPEEVDYVIDKLPPVIEKLRAMSPLAAGMDL